MPASLKLSDFSDRDLLYALEEAGDTDGWATAQEVADQIGISHPNPAHCVSARFAWLNRYGLMEHDIDAGERIWRLNAKGVSLLHPAELAPEVSKAIARLNEGQRVQLTDAVTRELPKSSREAAHMARRAYIHNFGGWRDKSLTPKRK